MTVFEKIKAMDIGKMAEFIVRSHDYAGIMDQVCKYCIHCVEEDSTCRSHNLDFDCIAAMRILLRQEVKDDGTCENESPVE